jgi:hypothetical protein
MQALLIGLDPPGIIKKEIYRLKNKVIDKCGYQQQVKESPHMTFLVNNFTNIGKVDKVLKKVTRHYSTFNVEVNGITYFHPKKSGTYILYLVVKKSENLERLQKEIVVETYKFSHGCLLQDYLRNNIPGYRYTREERTNIKNYGFPYVGRNWIPHISIAILSSECFKIVVGEDILKTKFQHSFTLKKIDFFKYNQRWHTFKNYRFTE